MSTVKDFEASFKAREISTVVEPVGLNCSKCWDCGFVWVSCDLGDGVKYSAWAFCRCYEGRKKNEGKQFQLPLHDYEMERLFPAKAFPIKAFVPSSFKSFDNGLSSKVSDFKRNLRESEKFWAGNK
jgi:hypothetical protein